MVGWTVEVLDSTAEAELDTFPHDLRAALTRIIERIGNLGLDRIGEPHVRHVEGKLWEMRPSGSHIEGRALYVVCNSNWQTGRHCAGFHQEDPKNAQAPYRARLGARQEY
jgi:hypothetical protein